MSRPQWGVSVGVGPIRVSGPAPTWGIRWGLIIGFSILGFMLALAQCDTYTQPPRPEPTPTAVTPSSFTS